MIIVAPASRRGFSQSGANLKSAGETQALRNLCAFSHASIHCGESLLLRGRLLLLLLRRLLLLLIRVLRWCLLLRLWRLDNCAGTLPGLASRKKWTATALWPLSLWRLVRIRRSDWDALRRRTGWRRNRTRRRRGRLSASGIDCRDIVRGGAQGAGRHEDQQFRFLNIGGVLSRQEAHGR